MDINARQVQELRTKTGAGIMDCKKALAEGHGDIEKAVEWLRKKGLSARLKKPAGLLLKAWWLLTFIQVTKLAFCSR